MPRRCYLFVQVAYYVQQPLLPGSEDDALAALEHAAVSWLPYLAQVAHVASHWRVSTQSLHIAIVINKSAIWTANHQAENTQPFLDSIASFAHGSPRIERVDAVSVRARHCVHGRCCAVLGVAPVRDGSFVNTLMPRLPTIFKHYAEVPGFLSLTALRVVAEDETEEVHLLVQYATAEAQSQGAAAIRGVWATHLADMLAGKPERMPGDGVFATNLGTTGMIVGA